MQENNLINKDNKNTRMKLEKFNGIMLIFIILVVYIFGNSFIQKLYYAPQLLASIAMILLWWSPKTLRQKYKMPLIIASGIILFHNLFNVSGPLPIGVYFYLSTWLFAIPNLGFFVLKEIPYILNNPLVYFSSTASPLGYLAFSLVQFLYVYLLTVFFHRLYKKNKVWGIVSLVIFVFVLYMLLRFPASPIGPGSRDAGAPLLFSVFQIFN